LKINYFLIEPKKTKLKPGKYSKPVIRVMKPGLSCKKTWKNHEVKFLKKKIKKQYK
jgi:hypothetical protein